MEWRTCAMVSTACISRATAMLLAHTADYVEYDPVDPLGCDDGGAYVVRDELQGENSLSLFVHAVPYGWQVYVNTEDPEIWEAERAELAERAPDLLAVIECVRSIDPDCKWIWFDRDADGDAELELFDWEKEELS